MVRHVQIDTPPHTVLIRGARQLLTLRGSPEIRRGAALRDLAVIPGGAVLIQEGRIFQTGTSQRVENVSASRGAFEINAGGRVVMPAFIDSAAQLLPDHPLLGGEDSGESAAPADLAAIPARRLE